MTNREKRQRARMECRKIFARMKKRFPRVEMLDFEDLPTGTTVLYIYAPYERVWPLLDVDSERRAKLIGEGIDVMILPIRHRRTGRAA